ncbi:DUF5666 domain-containing protein [Patescibacteria group bacterium]|nr:DUF5666 domain-containing protein [Patescibacteria group bacterium]
MTNKIIYGLITLALAGLAFYGGIKYQQKQAAARISSFSQNGGNNGQIRTRFGNGANGGAVRGEVLSVDANGLTVKNRDGSSRIVLFSGSTVINKADVATKDDIKTGSTVAVFGTINSDGSITAQNVQINPVQPPPPNPTQ